jgi:hypothetical protein
MSKFDNFLHLFAELIKCIRCICFSNSISRGPKHGLTAKPKWVGWPNKPTGTSPTQTPSLCNPPPSPTQPRLPHSSLLQPPLSLEKSSYQIVTMVTILVSGSTSPMNLSKNFEKTLHLLCIYKEDAYCAQWK